jgi:DNA-directed RNA polymerase specialized sigma24 family protein
MPKGLTPSEKGGATPAPSNAGRVDPAQLEKALASMTRMQEAGKSRVRAYFLQDMALKDIASRDAVSLETVANTVRRVRAKLNEQSLPPQGDNKPPYQGMVVVRARSEDLEKALAAMPRMQEQTKDRMRRHFLRGMDATAIAAQDGIRIEAVNNALRHVRAALAEQDVYWRQASFMLTLPIPLGQELQALSNLLPHMKRRADADALLDPIMRAVSKARKTLE